MLGRPCWRGHRPISPVVVPLVAALYLTRHRLLGLSYVAFSFVQSLLLFSFLLVPTTLMGATLPHLSQALIKREGSITRIVGTLDSLNTLGAVVGATVAGYGLIPVLGNRTTLWFARPSTYLWCCRDSQRRAVKSRKNSAVFT